MLPLIETTGTLFAGLCTKIRRLRKNWLKRLPDEVP